MRRRQRGGDTAGGSDAEGRDARREGYPSLDARAKRCETPRSQRRVLAAAVRGDHDEQGGGEHRGDEVRQDETRWLRNQVGEFVRAKDVARD